MRRKSETAYKGVPMKEILLPEYIEMGRKHRRRLSKRKNRILYGITGAAGLGMWTACNAIANDCTAMWTNVVLLIASLWITLFIAANERRFPR